MNKLVITKEVERFAELYALWVLTDGTKYINALSPYFRTDKPMKIFKEKYYGKGSYKL
jgi:hypothetical protein